jgi:hypothetical protein
LGHWVWPWPSLPRDTAILETGSRRHGGCNVCQCLSCRLLCCILRPIGRLRWFWYLEMRYFRA